MTEMAYNCGATRCYQHRAPLTATPCKEGIVADSDSIVSWRPIPGYLGYEASNDGRIRSLLRGGISVMRPHLNRHTGYRQLTLWVNRKPVTRKVSVLVLAAWAGPRPEKNDVRHLDGNKTNDAISNLAYGTHTENMADNARLGTTALGVRHGKSKLTPAAVLAIRVSDESLRVMAARHSVSVSTISHVIKRRSWRHLTP